VVLGLLLAAPAWGQVKKSALGDGPAVHRIEIWNGPVRTVRYVYQDLSPSEEAVLKELERAENEANLADQMTQVRQAYVTTELVMEPRRRQVQYLLYGYNSDTTAGLLTAGGIGGYGFGAIPAYGYGYGGAYGAYPYAFNSGYGGFGYGTMARASTVGPIRVALGLKEDKGGVSRVGFYTTGSTVTVTRMLEGKADKIEGKVLGGDDEWLVLDTKEGRRRILKTTIVDVLEPK
jgi:hypothetical protein